MQKYMIIKKFKLYMKKTQKIEFTADLISLTFFVKDVANLFCAVRSVDVE